MFSRRLFSDFSSLGMRVLMVGLITIVLFVILNLVTCVVFAADIETLDDVSVSVPVSCNLTGIGQNSHNAEIPNGTYRADIGTTTLKAFCNDSEGFAIYAAGYTGNEVGGTDSTKLVGVSNSILTGTATSGSTSNWAMKLQANASAAYAITLDSGFGNYSAVPTSYTKVAHRDSSTDIGSLATGAELTTTYAAFISQTETAGSYSGKVIYTLVHPATEEPSHEIACEARRVCYNSNTTTALGEMGKQPNTYQGSSTVISNGADVILWAPNFKRDGYGFVGWNTKHDYTGMSYGPNETIIAPADVETNGLPLYAMWVPSRGILQNWNGCSSMNIGDVTALTDSRDNNTYAVAKLADNKCWTIENMRLGDASELTVSNTNSPSLPLTNSWFFEYNQTVPATSNHLSSTFSPTQYPWCTNGYNASCTDQSMVATDNTVSFINNNSSNYYPDGNVYSYGNHYNWYSATAGNGTSAMSSGDALGDICPIGWHLPSGDTDGEFKALHIALSSSMTAYRKYPNNFVFSGEIYGSEFRKRGGFGKYFTATKEGGTVYFMTMDSSYVNPGSSSGAGSGGSSVRCIVDS